VKLYCTQLEAVVKPEAVQQQMETQNEPALAAKGNQALTTKAKKGPDQQRNREKRHWTFLLVCVRQSSSKQFVLHLRAHTFA